MVETTLKYCLVLSLSSFFLAHAVLILRHSEPPSAIDKWMRTSAASVIIFLICAVSLGWTD